MDVRVTGHQVDVGDSLQTQAVSRIEGLAEKYFPRAVAANVTFSPGPYADFVCDIVAPVINNVVLKAHQRAPEAHIAFEGDRAFIAAGNFGIYEMDLSAPASILRL